MRGFQWLAIVLLAAGVSASGPEADPWADFVGSWQGEGRFLGAPASAELRWERVLNDRFVRLNQRITVQRPQGPMTFEGHAYYPAQTDSAVTATWFDVEGHVYTINATVSAGQISSRWGPSGTVRGRTVYRLADGALSVVDSAPGRDGTWIEFGRLRYTAIR